MCGRVHLLSFRQQIGLLGFYLLSVYAITTVTIFLPYDIGINLLLDVLKCAQGHKIQIVLMGGGGCLASFGERLPGGLGVKEYLKRLSISLF